MANVCDECTTVVYDEGGQNLTGEEQAQMCVEMGADIADHRCEQFDGGERCDCACYGGPTVKHDQSADVGGPVL